MYLYVYPNYRCRTVVGIYLYPTIHELDPISISNRRWLCCRDTKDWCRALNYRLVYCRSIVNNIRNRLVNWNEISTSTSTSIAQTLNNAPLREDNEQKRENTAATTANVPSSHLRSHSYSHSHSGYYWPDLVHLCMPVSVLSAVYEGPRRPRSLRGIPVQVQHHQENLHGDPYSRPRRHHRAHQKHRTTPSYAVCWYHQHCVGSHLALHRRQAVRYTALQHGDGASHA